MTSLIKKEWVNISLSRGGEATITSWHFCSKSVIYQLHSRSNQPRASRLADNPFHFAPGRLPGLSPDPLRRFAPFGI
jgi:hypothetical protein